MQDYIINPKTGRPVKIGSRLYNSLVYNGVSGLEKSQIKADKNRFRLAENDDEYNDSEDEEKPTTNKSKLCKNDWISAISVLIYQIINDDNEVGKLQKKNFKELKKYVNKKIIDATKLTN